MGQVRHAVKRVVDEVVTKAVKDVADEVTVIRLKLASETGGNSNGLRQKLNEVSREMVTIGKDVAELKGGFNQLTQAK